MYAHLFVRGRWRFWGAVIRIRPLPAFSWRPPAQRGRRASYL